MMNTSKKLLSILAALLALPACQQSAEKNDDAAAPATQTSAPGGSSREPAAAGTISTALGGSPDHTTLVQALKTAGIVDTLSGAGPYTVFAPSNAAFQKLPAGTTEGLMQPQSKARLTELLTYHVAPGLVTGKDLAASIERGGGKTQLATIAGGTLTIARDGDALLLTDGKGGRARVTRADMMQSNGVVHAVDTVLQP